MIVYVVEFSTNGGGGGSLDAAVVAAVDVLHILPETEYSNKGWGRMATTEKRCECVCGVE